MLRIAILVAGALVALLLAVVALGYALPVAHVASRGATLALPPDRLHAVLSDVERYPTWRTDVDAVEILQRTPLQWRERGSNGTITFELRENTPPRKLVTRIADRTLPFGGTWTFDLAASGAGTRLTITEHGEVYSPLFRVMSRFIFGHSATIETYLADLGRSAR